MTAPSCGPTPVPNDLCQGVAHAGGGQYPPVLNTPSLTPIHTQPQPSPTLIDQVNQHLAWTGMDVWHYVLIGGLLLLVGIGCWLAGVFGDVR